MIRDKIRSWVYAGLLRKSVQDANAVAILRSKSLWGQALNLWRSLFETEVVCHYIGDRSSEDHLACRYVIHSVLRKTFRCWEAFNETCRRLGKEADYSPEEIQLPKGRVPRGIWRAARRLRMDSQTQTRYLQEDSSSDQL